MICFYDDNGMYGCFSNLYHSPFKYAYESFESAEDFVLYHRSLLFDSIGHVGKRRKESYTAETSKISTSQVSDFALGVWKKIRYNIVKRGVGAKFRQNRKLQEILLSTGNELIAACCPTDIKWGIGLGVDEPERLYAYRWKGDNLLGRILMEVREEIMQERMAAAIGYYLRYNMWEKEAIVEWKMTAGELKRIPQFYRAIHTYSDTLCGMHEKKAFYGGKLSGWEHSMEWNQGGGLPIIGFYEMKQEIYDIASRLRNLRLVSGTDTPNTNKTFLRTE